MTALLSAELLRVRTLRSTLYGTLGFLAFVGVLAAAPLVASGSGSDAEETMANVSSLLTAVVVTIGIVSANVVGAEYKRGTVAVTYLAIPIRARVTAAQMIIWGGACAALTTAAAALIVPLALAAAADNANVGISSGEVIRMIAGAGFGGAVLGSAGVLAATITREAVYATGSVVVLNIVESLVANGLDGIGPYLPLSLTSSVMGLNHDMPALAAMGLLLAYLAAFAVAVRRWALPRDLT